MSDQNPPAVNSIEEHNKEIEDAVLHAMSVLAEHYGSLDRARQAAEDVLKDATLVEKTFLHAVVRKKMKSMVALLRASEILEEKLYSDENVLRALTLDQAMAMWIQVQKRIQSDSELFQLVSSSQDAETMLKSLEHDTSIEAQADDVLKGLSQESRQKLLKAVSRLEKGLQ